MVDFDELDGNEKLTWMSVMSRGFLASQATAALQVIVCPWVACNRKCYSVAIESLVGKWYFTSKAFIMAVLILLVTFRLGRRRLKILSGFQS